MPDDSVVSRMALDALLNDGKALLQMTPDQKQRLDTVKAYAKWLDAIDKSAETFATAKASQGMSFSPALQAKIKQLQPEVASAFATYVRAEKKDNKKKDTDIEIPSPVVVQMETWAKELTKPEIVGDLFGAGARQVFDGVDFASASIETLVALVMMQCERTESENLRDQLKEMQAINAKKKDLRELKTRLKADEARMNSELRQEYDAGLASGAIHASVTFDQYKEVRKAVWSPDIESGAGEIIYAKPSLTPPGSLPAWVKDGMAGPAGPANGTGAVATAPLTNEALAAQAGLTPEIAAGLIKVYDSFVPVAKKPESFEAFLKDMLKLKLPPKSYEQMIDNLHQCKVAFTGMGQKEPKLAKADPMAAAYPIPGSSKTLTHAEILQKLTGGSYAANEFSPEEKQIKQVIDQLFASLPSPVAGLLEKFVGGLARGMVSLANNDSVDGGKAAATLGALISAAQKGDAAALADVVWPKNPGPTWWPGVGAQPADLSALSTALKTLAPKDLEKIAAWTELSVAQMLKDGKKAAASDGAETNAQAKWAEPQSSLQCFYNHDGHCNHLANHPNGDFAYLDKQKWGALSSMLEDALSAGGTFIRQETFAAGPGEVVAPETAVLLTNEERVAMLKALKAAEAEMKAKSGPGYDAYKQAQAGGLPPKGRAVSGGHGGLGGLLFGDPSAHRLVDGPPAQGAGKGLGEFNAFIQSVDDKLQSTGELSESQSMRLQMTMQRRSKFLETLTNTLAKMGQTSQAITNNLK